MAMSADILGPAIKSAVDSVTASAVASGDAVDRDELFHAMADAIISHITGFAVVTVAVSTAPGTAVGSVS